MTMVNFDFERFLFEKRMSAPELAKRLQMNYNSVWVMIKRKSIKMDLLRILESHFGDLSAYIEKEKRKTLNHSSAM